MSGGRRSTVAESSEGIARLFASESVEGWLRLWREEHAHATMREIELAVDERLAMLRAKLVSEVAMQSPLRDVAALPAEQRPRCERCGEALVSMGKRRRRMKGPGDQEVILERSYAVCPRCDLGVFPPR